jgi:FAD/FMN-containing dehydrogenase
VPQGGNTGLVGGQIATTAQIVLSLEHLSGVGDVDRFSETVIAGAGVPLERVQATARNAGFEFPVDFAARGSATIGGMVATNAGGSFVLRYGTMRDRVVGLQIVLADGSIVDHLRRPPKDSSGFDLTQLVPGSEGTLAVVTAARLSLVPAPKHRAVAMVALASLDDAVTVTARLRGVSSVEAIDFFLGDGLALVTAHTGLPAPFPQEHAAFLVVSCASAADPTHGLAEVLERSQEVEEVAVAQSSQQAERLWNYRELHNASINASGVPVKLDVAVRTDLVPELRVRVDAWLRKERPGAVAYYYGHLAEGNVHINVLGAAPADDASMEETVLGIVSEMGGSISAEHGIGRAKNKWLHLSRSTEEIERMRAIKAALDPNGILNPGKLLPG